MASPAATSAAPSLPLLDKPAAGDGGADDADFRFKQNRPSELAVAQSPMFAAGLPDSPGLFSPGQVICFRVLFFLENIFLCVWSWFLVYFSYFFEVPNLLGNF